MYSTVLNRNATYGTSKQCYAESVFLMLSELQGSKAAHITARHGNAWQSSAKYRNAASVLATGCFPSRKAQAQGMAQKRIEAQRIEM